MIRKLFLTATIAVAMLAADTLADARKMLAGKKYDEAIALLESANKTKSTPEVKKALAEANLAKGDAFMADNAVAPRVKYPTALRAYREALKYDKDNKKAQQNIATIEGIYKSMGRPVPQ